MRYMGSKRRIAKEILPIILKDRRDTQWYVEPFCGGCNLIDKVPQGRGRLANDIHLPLVSMFKALQRGWTPPQEVSELEYAEARNLPDDNPLKAFIGVGCSFGGKWFRGYARHATPKGKQRNYAKEAGNSLEKQRDGLVGVVFTSFSYKDLPIPSNSLIYCDPPYKGVTGYKEKIDYEEFYEWCREKKREGHTVFVSEYAMPEDFIEVWSKEQVTNLTNLTTANYRTEKLFTCVSALFSLATFSF